MLGCEKKGFDIVLRDPLTPLNNTKSAGKMGKVLGDVYKHANHVEGMMQLCGQKGKGCRKKEE